MKYLLLITLFSLFISCKNKENDTFDKSSETTISDTQKGKLLFEENKCATCHIADQKIVGPSLEEIATTYKKQNANLVSFLKEESEAIIDPSQYDIMKINLEVTKKMKESDLKLLETYMLSFAK